MKRDRCRRRRAARARRRAMEREWARLTAAPPIASAWVERAVADVEAALGISEPRLRIVRNSDG